MIRIQDSEFGWQAFTHSEEDVSKSQFDSGRIALSN